jgi:hypothetical protein
MSADATTFCNDLQQEHASLLQRLAHLEGAIESANGATVADHLRAIQEHLLQHFRFEERDGYMKHVLERAPHLHRKVGSLLAEHAEMAQDLVTLIGAAAPMSNNTPLSGAFRHRVRQLLSKIRVHEAHETDLVQEAANEELGTED